MFLRTGIKVHHQFHYLIRIITEIKKTQVFFRHHLFLDSKTPGMII